MGCPRLVRVIIVSNGKAERGLLRADASELRGQGRLALQTGRSYVWCRQCRAALPVPRLSVEPSPGAGRRVWLFGLLEPDLGVLRLLVVQRSEPQEGHRGRDRGPGLALESRPERYGVAAALFTRHDSGTAEEVAVAGAAGVAF